MVKNPTLYRGNVSSRIFHKPECRYYQCRNCKERFHSLKDAMEARYKACRKCEPDKVNEPGTH